MPEKENTLGSENPADWEEKEGVFEYKGKNEENIEKLFSPEEVELAEFGEKIWKILELMAGLENVKSIKKKYEHDITPKEIDRLEKLSTEIRKYEIIHPVKGLRQWHTLMGHYGGTMAISYVWGKERYGPNWQNYSKEEKEEFEQSRPKRTHYQDLISNLKELKKFYDENKELQSNLDEARQILEPILKKESEEN